MSVLAIPPTTNSSSFDHHNERFDIYQQHRPIHAITNARLIADYRDAADDLSFEAEQALDRIVEEFYDRCRVDLNAVRAHLQRAPKHQTEVDLVWARIERLRRTAAARRSIPALARTH